MTFLANRVILYTGEKMTKTKACNKCNIEKSLDEFSNDNGSKSGKFNICKACIKIQRLSRRLNSTPEEIELIRYKDRERKRKKYREDKEWREKEKKRNTANYRANKEWYHAYSTAYYKKNQERLDKYKYQQRLKQYKENPCVKLRDVTSGHVYYALKAVGSSKAGQSTTRHLPYTMDELRTHLESLFTPEMSWDNHGSYWHLDHIIPQAALPYDSMEHPNFIKCWALSNLQPLPASENISKGSLYEGKRYGKNKSQDT